MNRTGIYRNDDPRIGDIGSIWKEEELIEVTGKGSIVEVLREYDIAELDYITVVRLEQKGEL